MKKEFIYIIGGVILLSLFAFSLKTTNSDLVYVDVNKLVDGYKRTEKEREIFKKKATTLQANVDSLITDWQAELKSFEKERSSLTKKELELKKELLSNKQQQVNNYQKVVQRQIQEEDRKLTQTIINDINDYVKNYGSEQGYSMIFGANGAGNIMYANEKSDLTEEILEALNHDYEGQ